jgi:hypothetical protein
MVIAWGMNHHFWGDIRATVSCFRGTPTGLEPVHRSSYQRHSGCAILLAPLRPRFLPAFLNLSSRIRSARLCAAVANFFATRAACLTASSIRSTIVAIFRDSRSRAVRSLIRDRFATRRNTLTSCTNIRALARCRVNATCKSSRLAIASKDREGTAKLRASKTIAVTP